jgi:hypothetical protein
VDLTKGQYANNAIEFLQRAARKRLSSEYSETEKPKNPMQALDSLIREARILAGQEEEEGCEM